MEANRPSAQTRLGLSTEIRIAPEEFDEYVLEHGPVQLAFPLREFRVSSRGLLEMYSLITSLARSLTCRPLAGRIPTRRILVHPLARQIRPRPRPHARLPRH